MSIKSVLVPLNGCDSDKVTLDLSLMVARASNAHIEALFVKRDPAEVMAYAGWGVDPGGIQKVADWVSQEVETQASNARERFESWRAANELPTAERQAGAKDVTVGYCERVGQTRDQIVTVGRVADLIVQTGLFESEVRIPEIAIEAALFETGRPVLIAPETPPKILFDTALIAWNGSLEATRAVAAAMPFLGRYKQLFLFCQAENHRPTADPADLLTYLAWHGLKAERLRVFQEYGSVGKDLLAAADRVGAGLLVMGAYTHGRVRQMLFGGVTHHVLKHAAMPVLFAH